MVTLVETAAERKANCVKRHHIPSIVILLLLILAIAGREELKRGYEALLLTCELDGQSVPVGYESRPRGTRHALVIDAQGQPIAADLYLPEGTAHAGIVLAHGAVSSGKEDPRLVGFAERLARARFAVLVPDLAGPKALRIRAEDTQEIIVAQRYLRQVLGTDRPIGIGGGTRQRPEPGPRPASGGSLAVLAALDPSIRDDTDFLLLVGAYYNLPQTLSYGITGYYQANGESRYQAPNQYGKWLFVLSNSDSVTDPRDREFLRLIATSRINNPGAADDVLVQRLGNEGQAVMDYVANNDPARSTGLYAGLPLQIRRTIEALDLSNTDLTKLHAHVLLVHGYDDSVIPYPQSMALAQALPPDRAELFLYHGLEHVDTRLERLRDGWTLWHAVYALLQERDHL